MLSGWISDSTMVELRIVMKKTMISCGTMTLVERSTFACLHDPDSVIGMQSLQFQDDCVMGCMYGLPRELVPEFWHLVRNAMEALLMLDCVDDDQQLVSYGI